MEGPSEWPLPTLALCCQVSLMSPSFPPGRKSNPFIPLILRVSPASTPFSVPGSPALPPARYCPWACATPLVVPPAAPVDTSAGGPLLSPSALHQTPLSAGPGLVPRRGDPVSPQARPSPRERRRGGAVCFPTGEGVRGRAAPRPGPPRPRRAGAANGPGGLGRPGRPRRPGRASRAAGQGPARVGLVGDAAAVIVVVLAGGVGGGGRGSQWRHPSLPPRSGGPLPGRLPRRRPRRARRLRAAAVAGPPSARAPRPAAPPRTPAPPRAPALNQLSRTPAPTRHAPPRNTAYTCE